jgi:putative DNA primase/helicase
VLWDDDGSLSLGATRAALVASDNDAAVCIANEWEGMLHYVPGDAQWYVWDGTCHRPDQSMRIHQMCRDWAVRSREALRAARTAIALEIEETAGGRDRRPPDAALRGELDRRWKAEGWDAAWRYNAGLLKSAGMGSLERYLAGVCGTDVADFEFSRTEGYLNCANGTVSLLTGELRPHNPADMITYCLEWDYRGELASQATGFWGMAVRACADAESADYLLRVLGYSLLGRNPEHLFPFLAGPAGSGKSKVLWIVSQVLGRLAHSTSTELIAQVPHGRNARTENSIRSKRLVIMSEMSSRIKLDEAQVKRLTGEPEITVNQHYAKTEIRTPVTWLPFGATNDLPSVASFDSGLRRRIAVIPGGESLAPWEIDVMKAERVLAAEGEAILALLVRAAMRYYRDGLPQPLSVEVETARYVASQDTVDAFTAECCEKPDGSAAPGAVWETTASAMWMAYREWARGLAYLGRNEFYLKLGAKEGVAYSSGRRRFTGIRLNAEWAMRS